jgi:hypothetical protein
MQNILNGLAPWASGTTVMYPPLAFIPMMISYGVSLASGMIGFIVSMWVLMVICDIVTIFCIYWIGLKLYSERTAFLAAMLYATAISVAYYSLTKFDAFPTSLVMLAILATVYGDKTKGYVASIVGLFVKIYPVILYPFLWIYNSRRTSLIAEGKKRAALIAIPAAAIFIIMVVAGYNLFLGYASTVYCNTIQFALLQYLQIAGVSVQSSDMANAFRVVMGIVILGAMYYLYKKPKTIGLLIKVILISIMAIVFLMQYRSPQYIVWFTPFAVLLVADNVRGILIFAVVQILSFIEFPLAFWTLYTNAQYTSPLALGFFTVYFLAYGVLLWQALTFAGDKKHAQVA